MKVNKIQVMLDSGAFSVHKIGAQINLFDYIEFCQQHVDSLYCCINLDVIPGRFGRQPGQHEVDEAARKSWINYLEMRRAQLDPMVVYHIGERRYWLEKMLGAGCGYIGLGGLVGVDSERRKRFLDEVFTFLCGQGGYPATRIHGLGVTQPQLIHRYPFHSVDSSGWLSGSKTGVIPIARLRGKYYDFSTAPLTLKISETKEGKADLGIDNSAVLHYRTLGPRLKHYVDRYFEHAKLDLGRLQAEYGYRCKPAAFFLRRCADTHPNTPFAPAHHGFFKADPSGHGTCRVPQEQPRIFLVMPVGGGRPSRNHYSRAAVEAGMDCHLFSYLSVRKCLSLEQYVKTGDYTATEEAA